MSDDKVKKLVEYLKVNDLYDEAVELTEYHVIPFEDKEYIVERVNKIIDAIPEIDKAIDEVAVGWKTDRMGKVELSILRLAYYEMAMDDEVPGKVAVDQAVILAKKYGSDNAPAFINGILAKLFQE